MGRSKQTSRKRKEPETEQHEFFTTHFGSQRLRKRYYEQFMTRSDITSYFVNLHFLDHLAICDKTLRDLVEAMGWTNLLTLREPIYPSLVKVFYSNMLISDTAPNKIFTSVGGVEIAFDVEELNRILMIPNEGFQVFSCRKKIQKPWFNVVDAVRNICRRSDLSEFFCNASFKAQALPLQVRVLHSIIQHFISIRTGHFDEVTRLDVCLLDSILVGRKVDVGYILVQHMLDTPDNKSRSLPYGSIITRVLKYFKVPITEPPLDECKELGEEIITSLGFQWNVNYDVWQKNQNLNNKPTVMAPTDLQMFNDVMPPDKLPDMHIYLQGASRSSRANVSKPRRRGDDPSSSSADAAIQMLLSEVRTISSQIATIQSKQQHLVDQQQQLFQSQEHLCTQQQQILDGQQLIFRNLGISLVSSSFSHPQPPPPPTE